MIDYGSIYAAQTAAIEELREQLAAQTARADKLVAELGICVAALEDLARLGNGRLFGNSEGNLIAQKTLAALEDKPHE